MISLKNICMCAYTHICFMYNMYIYEQPSPIPIIITQNKRPSTTHKPCRLKMWAQAFETWSNNTSCICRFFKSVLGP